MAGQPEVVLEDNFDQQRLKINEIGANVGDVDTLSGGETNTVDAINNLNTGQKNLLAISYFMN